MSNGQIIPADLVLPNKLHILPIKGQPIFPGLITPLVVQDQGDIEVVNASFSAHQILGFILVKSKDTELPDSDDLYRVGTVAKIIKRLNLPDGGINIFVTTLKRFTVKKFINTTTPITAAVEYANEEIVDSTEVKALTRALLSEMKQISENNPLFSEEMRLNMVNIDHPGKIADFITSILNIDRKDQQKILETFDVRKRMENVLVFIKKEQELLKIQKNTKPD
jgi:ATP-dependent Lon protease